MPSHAPSIPSLVGQTANKAFLSTLSIVDRSYSDKLVQKYGAGKYTQILEMLGKKTKVENGSFYHFEERKAGGAFQVASITGGASAGVTAVLTLAAGSHYDSGTKSPIRVGEVIMWANNGRLAKITAINTSTPSAHTATVFPLQSTIQFNPGANDFMLNLGILNVGEASDTHTAFQPLVDKITNTVTEVREDYEFTDKAGMEKIEWRDPSSGMYYYQYYGTQKAETRWLNARENLCMFSTPVNVATFTATGTVGTTGVIPQVQAGGSTLTYTAGSLNAITDVQAVTRDLQFNGAASEVHWLCDVYQHQELQSKLFTQYNQGAILWGSAGGSNEVAAKLGFSSYYIDGFNFHFKKYDNFQPEKIYGVAPATYKYKNYGLIIPQGFGNDPVSMQSTPTISLRYQEVPGKGEIHAYETGGLAGTPTSNKQDLHNVIIGHYGVQVAAANQCVILAVSP